MRIIVRLILKVAPYGISISKARCSPPHLLKAYLELEMGIRNIKKKFPPPMISKILNVSRLILLILFLSFDNISIMRILFSW